MLSASSLLLTLFAVFIFIFLNSISSVITLADLGQWWVIYNLRIMLSWFSYHVAAGKAWKEWCGRGPWVGSFVGL